MAWCFSGEVVSARGKGDWSRLGGCWLRKAVRVFGRGGGRRVWFKVSVGLGFGGARV